jgi:hypothetical protein
VAVSQQGNYACVTAGGAGLQVFDITSPGLPVWRGTYDTSGDAQDVAVSGNYAYVADGEAGLQVIDISNKANPQRVGGYDTFGNAHDVAISGNYAYVADGDAGLQVIDITMPAKPKRIGGNPNFSALGVAIHGDKVFVAAEEGGLVILDAFRPYRLEAMPVTTPSMFSLQVGGPRNVPVCLERSRNVNGPWEFWQCVTPTDGVVEVSDLNFPNEPTRFYRVVPVP